MSQKIKLNINLSIDTLLCEVTADLKLYSLVKNSTSPLTHKACMQKKWLL